MKFYLAEGRVVHGRLSFQLSPNRGKLFGLLAAHHGRLVTQRLAWRTIEPAQQWADAGTSLRVLLLSLRQQFKAEGLPLDIETVWGRGFILHTAVEVNSGDYLQARGVAVLERIELVVHEMALEAAAAGISAREVQAVLRRATEDARIAPSVGPRSAHVH